MARQIGERVTPLEGRLFARLPYPLGAAILLVEIAVGAIVFAVFQEYVPKQVPQTGDAWGGILLGAYGSARFLMETPTGALADRVERKLALLIGFVLMVPPILAMIFVNDRWAFLGAAFSLGLGTAFLWPAAYAIAADFYPAERRGKVVGFLNLGQILGFGIGALAGALLIEEHSDIVLVIAAAATAAAGIATFTGIPRYRAGSLFSRVQFEDRPSLWSVMTTRLASFSAITLFATIAVAMIVPAIRPLGDEHFEISFATLTILLIPGIVVSAVLYIPAGHLADSRGRWTPFVGGQGVLVAGLLLVPATTSLPFGAAAAVLIFAGNVLSVPAWNAAIMDMVPPSHRGTLIGFTVALNGLGLAVGPFVGGLIVDGLSAAAAFRIAAAGCGLTALAVLVHVRAFRDEGTTFATPR